MLHRSHFGAIAKLTRGSDKYVMCKRQDFFDTKVILSSVEHAESEMAPVTLIFRRWISTAVGGKV